MNTLKEDLRQPLNKVERKCLRRSAVLLLTPLMVLLAAFAGIFDMMTEFYEECW